MSTLTALRPATATLIEVPARDLHPGDLIGGTNGQWLTVTRPPVVNRGMYGNTEATITVTSLHGTSEARPWLMDANITVAVIRGSDAP